MDTDENIAGHPDEHETNVAGPAEATSSSPTVPTDPIVEKAARALIGAGRPLDPDLRDESGEASSARPFGSLLNLSIDADAEELQTPALPYPVVGIGASAGGLKAFREVLEHLAPDTGMAFVLVTHMSPDHKSYLAEIIERYTKMPVLPVVAGERPQPNHLYVLMPNQVLQIKGGAFVLEDRSDFARPPLVIDTFFRSLAADQKNHAIGVVLSGADSDGASGLKTIKGEGGIALVQTPASADHPGMPRNSIYADHVDLVVPPAELAIELGRLGYEFSRPDLRSLEDGVAPPDDDTSFQRILQLLRTVSGVEMRQYKPETLRRRMARRVMLLRKESLADYYKYLQMRPDELRLLHEDLLINVTRFFRDPGLWESLREQVLPELLRNRGPDRPLRVWSAGCSTGEEAYSLAIVILEYMSAHGLDLPLLIFGTDASDNSIEKARLAVYPESLASEISPERLRRFFVPVDRGFQVSKRVRDLCIFARQNLCSDPPFSHIDILTCRNVMIYFNHLLQRQLMITFHWALEPGGYLALGTSEGLRGYSDIFATVDRKQKIYQKTGALLPNRYEIPRSYEVSYPALVSRPVQITPQAHLWPEMDLQRAADRIVLARFGPAGLIVDDALNVVQFRGQTSPYVEITPGAVSWNLLRVLKESVANEARAAVQRSVQDNVPTTAVAVLNDPEGGGQQVQIEVLPLGGSSARPRCFLVLFRPVDTAAGRASDVNSRNDLFVDEKDRLAAQLRHDLHSTRFHLQSLIEERDTRNQEMMSANEEIQSANEELQSSNEELEITKEELQSANEELQTLNEELQQRNMVLTQTGNDLTNLLNSVHIPLLMLTSDLHIRQFTPPMQRLLSVRPADIGRSISEIRLQLSIENIEPILHQVLETLGARELEVQDRDGRWHLLRVRPYRTSENKIEGLVVVLLDIDQLRRSQQQLVDAHHFASTLVQSVPVPIVVANSDLTVRTSNQAFRELSAMSVKELNGRSLPDLMQHLWFIDGMRARLEELLEFPDRTLTFEHESGTSKKITLQVNGQVLTTEEDRILLIMLEDITLRRESERQVAQQKEALQSKVQLTERALNRTKEELRSLAAHLFTVQEEERERIARELHDDVGQRLSLIQMQLAQVQTGKGSRATLDLARQQLESLNTDVRQLSHLLHPAMLKDLGLSAALRSLIEEFGTREEMPTSFFASDLPENIPDATATAIYRITQEALRNVAKHAGRTHVKVSLQVTGEQLELKVTDFGIGFDQEAEPPRGGLGMISMQERARNAGGEFEVHSALGSGTTIRVCVPVTRR